MTLTSALRAGLALGLGGLLVAATPAKKAAHCAARTADACQRKAGCVWTHKACKLGLPQKTVAHKKAGGPALAKREPSAPKAAAKAEAVEEVLQPPPSEQPGNAAGVDDDY